MTAGRSLTVAVAVLLLTLAVLAVMGSRSRRSAHERVTHLASHPREFFDVWRAAGVKGRVVYWFDRHISIELPPKDLILKILSPSGGSEEITDETVLTLAMQAGILRKVFHVVPESTWSEVEGVLKRFPTVLSENNGRTFRLTVEGVPVIVTREQDLPVGDERVLVVMNDALSAEYSPETIRRYREDPAASDVVIRLNRRPEQVP